MTKARIAIFTLVLATIIGLCPAARAHTYDNKDHPMTSDFYFGGYGGWSWTDADSGGSSFDVNGNDWGVFLGYNLGALMDKGAALQGGLEAHYGWGSNADDTVAGVTLKKEREWGVDFRPGLSFISDSMPLGLKPYGILGYRQAQFHSSATGNSTHPGFNLGVGTELLAYDNFGVRLDYSHVFYKEDDGVDPDEDDLRAGVAFHF
jgi:hypothetical protein